MLNKAEMAELLLVMVEEGTERFKEGNIQDYKSYTLTPCPPRGLFPIGGSRSHITTHQGQE